MILLAALAAFGWGASDFLGGLSRSRTLVFSILVASELVGAAMIAPALLATGVPNWSGHLLLACVAGVGVTVELGVVYYALSVGAAFITASVGALGSAIAVICGLIGGDPLTPLTGAGLLLAVSGGGLSSASRGGGGADLGLGRIVVACLIAAVGAAAMQITLHAAGAVNPYWAAELEHLSTAASAGLIVVGFIIRGRSASDGTVQILPERTQLPLVALTGLAGAGADVAYAAASAGSLSTVSAIASLYPIPTIALAFLIQHRRAQPIQLAGTVLALAGAALLGAAS